MFSASFAQFGRFLAVVVLMTLLPAGCGSKTGSDETPPPKTEDKTQPARRPDPPKPKPIPLAERKYGGYTIAEWEPRIKDINPRGADGRAAVDGLAALIRDEEVPALLRRRAAVTLGSVGRGAEESVPVLAEILRKHNGEDGKGDEESTLIALKALMLLGPFAKAATPDLIAVFNNRNRSLYVRRGALDALAFIGKADPQAVQAVGEALEMPRESGMSYVDWYGLRGQAADGVAMIGSVATPIAILKLRKGARNLSDDEFRRKCVVALGTLGTRDAVVPLAESMTKDFSAAVRNAAAESLAKLGVLSVPVLRKLLKHEDKTVAALAAKSLGRIGPPAKEAVKDLDFALDDDDGWLRINSAEAIWRITGETKTAVAQFIEDLESPKRQIRMRAYQLFKELGPKAKAAEGPLKRMLKDPRGYVRTAAGKALRAIQTDR